MKHASGNQFTIQHDENTTRAHAFATEWAMRTMLLHTGKGVQGLILSTDLENGPYLIAISTNESYHAPPTRGDVDDLGARLVAMMAYICVGCEEERRGARRLFLMM